jgi:hypothetical protein
MSTSSSGHRHTAATEKSTTDLADRHCMIAYQDHKQLGAAAAPRQAINSRRIKGATLVRHMFKTATYSKVATPFLKTPPIA